MHYVDVTMASMASQITSLTIVYSAGYSGTDQTKHQSPVSLAFVRGIHRGPGTGEFSAQMASNAENVSFWWRHHGMIKCDVIFSYWNDECPRVTVGLINSYRLLKDICKYQYFLNTITPPYNRQDCRKNKDQIGVNNDHSANTHTQVQFTDEKSVEIYFGHPFICGPYYL